MKKGEEEKKFQVSLNNTRNTVKNELASEKY